MMYRKRAKKFMDKAEQDMVVLRKWRSDPDISDEILGFHSQQAAEKMLKSVLVYRGIDFPFTHRLSDLIDIIKDNNIAMPNDLEEIRFLTPFAVEYRYDFFGEDDEVFDFEEIYILLAKFRKWAEAIIFL